MGRPAGKVTAVFVTGRWSRAACGLVLAIAATGLQAQQRFLIEGIADAELYHTDSQSLLLSRNDGDLSGVGRLQLWSAYQLTDTLQIYALGEFETEDASGSWDSEAELEQLAIRYTRTSAPYIVIEAGRILGLLSVFSDWHLSTRNPLIGQLYTHPTTYPDGIQVSGSAGDFDYRAAVVDQPDYNPDFVDVYPDSAYRPLVGFGWTPLFGLRFGASWTAGPYLNSQYGSSLPTGASWRDFDQTVYGVDFQFSRGYFELNGEWARIEYEVPYRARDLDDSRWFVEAKYTFTPRLYLAGRLQGVDGVFIELPDGHRWTAHEREFTDLELGVGYRLNADLTLKISYRTDHWREGDPPEHLPDGHALAAQLSFSLDPLSWFRHD